MITFLLACPELGSAPTYKTLYIFEFLTLILVKYISPKIVLSITLMKVPPILVASTFLIVIAFTSLAKIKEELTLFKLAPVTLTWLQFLNDMS
jgi:hypothetical protein